MFNKVVYCALIMEGSEARDGESATTLTVTEENNGLLVWYDDIDDRRIEKWFYGWERERAIEFAVDRGRELRKELATKKQEVSG